MAEAAVGLSTDNGRADPVGTNDGEDKAEKTTRPTDKN